MNQKVKIFVHMHLRNGQPNVYYVSTYKMDEKPNTSGGQFIFVKELEIDCTPPEGWDYRPIAVTALRDQMAEAKKKFSEYVIATERQINSLLALEMSSEPAKVTTQAPYAFPVNDDINDIPF